MTTNMHWARWGDPGQAEPLSDSARSLVRAALGISAGSGPEVALEQVRLPEPRLDPAVLTGLRGLLGDEHVRTDHESRVRHTRGKSTPDLLKMRAGDAGDAPDAVLRPADHDDVQAVIGYCTEHRVAVVPFGGGTSVVGGLTPDRIGFAGTVALDLGRLDRLLSLDAESSIAELGAGVRGPAAEALLAEHGYTLGHFPQSYEYASVGGFAATRSSGQASAGYGRFDSMVMGLRVATPIGTLELGRAPATAAGPDLRQVFLGSEGAFGVITAVTLRVHRLPTARVYDAWQFHSFAAGSLALRDLAQSAEPAPTVLRLSDEAETAVGLAKPATVGTSPSHPGCLMIVGFEGEPAAVEERRAATSSRLTVLGGERREDDEGAAWAEGRYRGPYLRDALLDEGVLVETLETATFWSNLTAVYESVRDAITSTLSDFGTPPIVLCHVSHVYPTGASLYFTVAAKEADDPLAQWQAAKTAASEAVVAAGATITHHHAVGRDHKPWLDREVGSVGVEILRAVKARLDPAGILNPGVLIP